MNVMILMGIKKKFYYTMMILYDFSVIFIANARINYYVIYLVCFWFISVASEKRENKYLKKYGIWELIETF